MKIGKKQSPKKLLLVVQRYGTEINGGAEMHCRWIAEHLDKFFDIEVLTTRALDYISWKNHYKSNNDSVNNIKVNRYKVARERNIEKFAEIQDKIFNENHSIKDEREWVRLNGPYSPHLLNAIKRKGKDADALLFWSYRYWQTYEGLKLYPSKSILIPTAEKDKLLDLPLFRQELNLPAGIIYLTNEEKDIIEKSAANTGKPNIISACGINIKRPDQKTINDFLRRYDIKKPFLLYVGRIDPNKGCMQLFDFYTAFKQKNDIEIDLILLGKKMMEIPERSDIKSLGFVNDEDKYAAISSADILLMPSFFESLSIVLLEAWALGSVTLANGLCDVLKGQTKRSNAGLYYGNYLEFEEGLKILLKDKSLKISLGENGKNFIQEHYNWDKISFEYRDFINRIINESQ